MLKRVSFLSAVCGLDAKGVDAGINVEINLDYPESDAFYWLTNDFNLQPMSYFFSIKKATQQAAQLDIFSGKLFHQNIRVNKSQRYYC